MFITSMQYYYNIVLYKYFTEITAEPQYKATCDKVQPLRSVSYILEVKKI